MGQRCYKMKKLIIKVIYEGIEKKIEVPYTLSTRINLPDEYPFNQNIYLGPDNGFSMSFLYIDSKGRIEYCDEIVELHDGVNIFSPFKGDRFVFNFELKEM